MHKNEEFNSGWMNVDRSKRKDVKRLGVDVFVNQSMSWAQASARCRGKMTVGDRTGILLCLDEGTGCTHLNYEEWYILKREERETARRLGEKYKSLSPQYCYHHKRHFLWEIPLTVIHRMTLSANPVSALPVRLNWVFGNYKDRISISRLGCWIFKQSRYGFPLRVSQWLNQPSPPLLHS